MITFSTVNESADIAPTANFDFAMGYFRALDETGYVISW
jgi:hypothetical protein